MITLNNIVYLNGYIVHFMDYVSKWLKVIIFIEDIYIYYIYIFMYTLLFIILNYSEGASPDVIE